MYYTLVCILYQYVIVTIVDYELTLTLLSVTKEMCLPRLVLKPTLQLDY